MKIAFAFCSFKNGASPRQINQAIQQKVQKLNIEAQYFQLSDGGENTAASLSNKSSSFKGWDALQRPIEYNIAFINDIPIIEMAQTVGIEKLSKDELNPFVTTSYGFGEATKQFLSYSDIYLTVGGSATVDFGFGFLKGLGCIFLDQNDNEVYFNVVKDIIQIQKIIIPDNHPNITVLCDVKNMLTGETGAVRVFGPQKGLQSSDFEIFDKISTHVKMIINKEEQQGDGAAGGIVYVLRNLFNAKIVSGAEFVLEAQNFEDKTQGYDILFTGEGQLDSQSSFGKACQVVCQKFQGKKIGIFGQIKTNVDFLDAIFSCQKGIKSLDEALKTCSEDVSDVVYNIINVLLM
eukprot:EST45344.1 Glycerate kinase [Spironucleus salmonicida]